MNTASLSIAVIVSALVVLAMVMLLRSNSAAAAPGVGTAAPNFDLLDQHSKRHQLADYRGQWLVLYFYPKDDTPGCTTEACQFRDDYYQIKALGAVVLGVSLDDVSSHKAFAEKYHLPFALLADREHKVAQAYGVLTGFGAFKFSSRQTFIIDPQGQIARHYKTVRPKHHATEIIADLTVLTEIIK